MDTKKRSIWYLVLKIVPVCITVGTIIAAVILFRNWTFDDIINFTPDNIFLSILVILGLYAVKSMSVVIPLTIFFVAAGVMYGAVGGILVSILGLSVSFTVPYLVGKVSGTDLVDALKRRYPKIQKITDMSDRNNFFVSYVTRAVVFVPGDVVSMLHGASGIRYVPYLFGSLLGLMPEMIFQVMIGYYLGEEISTMMIVSLFVMIAASAAISVFINKKTKKKQ